MKNKINEQLIIVAVSIVIVIIAVISVGLFQNNKIISSKQENTNPAEKVSAAILKDKKIKFGDKDFALYFIEPINYGLAMYYSGDKLGSEVKSRLIVNQYGNKISAKALATGIIDETGNDNSLLFYSNIIQSFTAPDSKGRDSYYITMRDVGLMASTSIRMHVIKVFEDNGATYSLIFQDNFELNSDLDEEQITKDWIADNATKYGQALDNVDITKSIDFYNQNKDLSNKLSVSNKFKSLKWEERAIKETTKHNRVDLKYPRFIGGAEVNKLNDLVKSLFNEVLIEDRAYASGILENGLCWTGDDGKEECDSDRWECRDAKEYTYGCGIDLSSEYNVISIMNDIVSIKFVLTDYTGGGNGDHSKVTVINYDLKTDQRLESDQLFCGTDYLEKLKPIVRANIYTLLEEPLDEIDSWIEDGIATSTNYENIGIGDFGISIYFQPYSVAAGAYGIIKVFIPYSDLTGVVCFPEFVAENNFIPLSKGSYWLYRVTGEQLVGDGQDNEIIKTNELFKIEVLNSVRRDANLRVALLNGYPGRSMTTRTLIVVAEKDYYLVGGDEAFNRILDAKDDLTGLYSDDDLVLSFPLTVGKKFGCDEESMNRKDNYYCNWIESIKPADASIFPNKTQYQISYYTLPDASSYYYVNNVGVTYATYHHNGSLNDEKWNLVKYYFIK